MKLEKKKLGIGTSLWPIVKSGFELTIDDVASKQYETGDLALFDAKHIQVCHRVLGKKEESGLVWYFMKGDGKLEADGWIPEYRMQGRVSKIDGNPVNKFPLSLFSKCFYWQSKIQWLFYRIVFLSKAGERLRDLRSAYVGPNPVFSRAFLFVLSPWMLLKR